MLRVLGMFLLFALVLTSASSQEVELDSDADLYESFPEQINDTVVMERCPHGWKNLGSRCIRYFRRALNWAAAETECMRLGGHLVSIHNAQEYETVKALIRYENCWDTPSWIGLADCQMLNSHFWSDGSKLTFTRWNPYMYNHFLGECCVHMNWGDKNWSHAPCRVPRPYMCAKRF